ncbi:hypothetical protein EPUL_004313, partial [Erysiphe pulchra]
MAKLIHPDVEQKNSIPSNFFEGLGKKTDLLTSTQIDKKHKSTIENVNSPSEIEDPSVKEEDQKVVEEIESLCMNCHKNGTTRLLLTRIPYFREVILSSFFCPYCYFKNSEVQAAGEIQQKGCRYELRLTSLEDLARQVVKSDTCRVKFIELDIEIPPGRGQLTNVEGILRMILEDLELQQPERKEQIPEVWAKINDIIIKGNKMIEGDSFPFRIEVDDPAGNSWIEPDHKDGVGKLSKVEYPRSREQNEALSLAIDDDQEQSFIPSNQPIGSILNDKDIVPDEVYSFPATCPGCTKYCDTHMKMVEIPHFKQVVIMSTVCDHCGYRSNEVKTGGEVPEKGKRIILTVEDPSDLARDILKSESCALESPELSLSVNPGTLGGRFTTVEGLLTQVRDDLHQHIFNVGESENDVSDSLPSETINTWTNFFFQLDEAIKGKRKFTVVLTDPLGSSYVQNLCLPHDDPHLKTEEYERTREEEDDLGLTDMKTEGYLDTDQNEEEVVVNEI